MPIARTRESITDRKVDLNTFIRMNHLSLEALWNNHKKTEGQIIKEAATSSYIQKKVNADVDTYQIQWAKWLKTRGVLYKVAQLPCAFDSNLVRHTTQKSNAYAIWVDILLEWNMPQYSKRRSDIFFHWFDI